MKMLSRRVQVLLLALPVIAACVPTSAETPGLRKQYLFDNVLRRHVRDGRVDYAALKADAELGEYLTAMSGVSLEDLRSDQSRKAFWINVYNACVLKSIADSYPVAEVKGVPGMFGESRWTIAGKTYSLDQMLNDVLRAFGDPLVHFGLCNGARGAPKLRSRSYTAYDVDRQLDDAAREYLRDDRNVKLNKITQHLTVPLVFRQYPTDFEPKGVAEFVSRYFPEKRERVFVASRRLTLDYAYFDWRVNALEEKPDKGKPEAAAGGQKPSGSGKPKAGEKQGKGKVWSSRDGEWKDK
jgi:hypothetical protein